MKKTLFITGFPGFLASSLLQQLYEDHSTDVDHVYLLISRESLFHSWEGMNRFIN